MNKTIKNQKGFTLIEIIAVLIILGILAAVAVPKYIDMQGEAKKAAVKGQIAEMKSTLNLAYAKQFLSTGTKPTDAANIVSEASMGTTMGLAPDNWTVSATASGTNAVVLSVTARGGDGAYIADGTWSLPQ